MASISESEKRLVRICGEKTGEDVMSTTWKMKVSGHRKVGITKLRWRDVIQKRHEGDWSTERRSTIQKNVDNETLDAPTPNSEKAELKMV